ncbi:unnamed protein product, partial [marine sediment metagenome]
MKNFNLTIINKAGNEVTMNCQMFNGNFQILEGCDTVDENYIETFFIDELNQAI